MTKQSDKREKQYSGLTSKPVKIKSHYGNEVTVPDDRLDSNIIRFISSLKIFNKYFELLQRSYYHYIYNKQYDTDVYIATYFNQKDPDKAPKIVIAWRGTELTAEDGFDKDDVLQDAKFFTG